MQIGFVNFNQDERNKVYKVLQLLKDQGAIDELGIGRLRDAFSNALFPGASTLQGHAKYFAVMPSLYYQAQKKHYVNLNEVRNEIRRMEIVLTKKLLNGTPEYLRKGITGSENVEEALKDVNKYVKYDPTYIYQSGMITYGLMKPKGNIYAFLLERSRQYQDSPQRLRQKPGDDDFSDADELSGGTEYFSTSGEVYDFNDPNVALSLELTKKEAYFLKSHIENIKSSLQGYILKHDLPIEQKNAGKNLSVFDSYEMLGELWKGISIPSSFRDTYNMSLQFARFVHLLHIIYEWVYAERTEDIETADRMKEKWADVTSDHRFIEAAAPNTIEAILARMAEEVTEPYILKFCRKGASDLTTYFNSPSPERLNELKDLVVNREKEVKGAKRSKLLNASQYRGVLHGLAEPLSYRWASVRTIISEIKKGLNNG